MKLYTLCHPSKYDTASKELTQNLCGQPPVWPQFPRRHRFLHVRHIAFAETNALANVSFLLRKKCKYNTILFAKARYSCGYTGVTCSPFQSCNYLKVYNKVADSSSLRSPSLSSLCCCFPPLS